MTPAPKPLLHAHQHAHQHANRPTIGGLLSKFFSKAVPAYVAAGLFVFNFVTISGMLPNDDDMHEAGGRPKAGASAEVKAHSTPPRSTKEHVSETVARIRRQTVQLVSTPGLGSLTMIKVVFSIFSSAAYTFAAKYVSEKYALEPHHMGFLSTYQSILSLVSQTYLVGVISKRLGTERTLQVAFLATVVVAMIEGSFRSVSLYVALVPLRTVAGDLISQMFETMMTTVVPKSEAASLFGTLNLLKAMARVCGPLYGGLLFAYCGKELGLYARPVVESVHNAIVLGLLLAAYPILHSAMLPVGPVKAKQS